MFKVKYGDDYLTDYVRFIKVNRGVASESELLLEENSGDGTKVLKSRRKAKEISMTFHVIDGLDVNVVREKLGKIISTTETKQLIFSDNPNFYYEAILTGTIEYTDDGFNANGGFTLLIPKGYSESVDTKKLNNDNSGEENGTIINNADNSVSIFINNKGTLPIYPTIKTTLTSETGFLAFVGEEGVLQIGNPDEADTTTAKSQKLVCDFKTQSDFETNFVPDTSWTTSWPTNIEGMPLNSTIGWKDDGIRIKSMKNTNLWNAGVLRYEVPKDDLGNYVKDWHAYFNTLFIQKNLDQCGRFQIHFADENKQPLAAFEIYKGKSGSLATVNFWLIGGDKRLHFYQHHDFDATTGKADKNGSPFFGPSKGGQAIIKQGNKLSFYWKGVAQTYLLGDLAAQTNLAYVYVVEAKRYNYQMVADTSLKEFKLTNLNNEYMVDIPNKYQPEDEVKVDMDKSKITVNDLGANSDYITGSEFFSIPPGTSQKLDIVYSNFTTSPPKVEIEWKERIL